MCADIEHILERQVSENIWALIFLQLVRRVEPGTAGERYHLCAMFPTLLRIEALQPVGIEPTTSRALYRCALTAALLYICVVF